MYNIRVKLSSKTNVNGESQILVRIDISRTYRPQLKTGIYIPSNLFDPTTGRIIVQKNKYATLSEYHEALKASEQLKKFKFWLGNLTLSAAKYGIIITTSWLQEMINLHTASIPKIPKNQFQVEDTVDLSALPHFPREHVERIHVYDYCYQYIIKLGLKGTYRSSFENLSKMLVRYEIFRRCLDRPDFVLVPDNLTKEDIADIRRYCKEEYALVDKYPTLYINMSNNYRLPINNRVNNYANKRRGDNSVRQMMRLLSMVWHWMVRENITLNNPFDGITIGTMIYSTPIYISNLERDHIAQFDLKGQTKGIQETRDIFIFQSLVGCRVSDLFQLTADNINGNFLEYIPLKTRHRSNNVTPRIPLVPQAKAIIDKYADFRMHDKQHRLFPAKTTSVYNEQIKKLFTICGITRKVSVIDNATGEVCLRPINEIASSHMARRTFAGNIYSKVKDPNIVGKMTGHIEGSRAFARYRKIDDEVLIEAISAIDTRQDLKCDTNTNANI